VSHRKNSYTSNGVEKVANCTRGLFVHLEPFFGHFSSINRGLGVTHLPGSVWNYYYWGIMLRGFRLPRSGLLGSGKLGK
jgi:hypothetical protein